MRYTKGIRLGRGGVTILRELYISSGWHLCRNTTAVLNNLFKLSEMGLVKTKNKQVSITELGKQFVRMQGY